MGGREDLGREEETTTGIRIQALRDRERALREEVRRALEEVERLRREKELFEQEANNDMNSREQG